MEVVILCGGYGTRFNSDKNKKKYLKPLVKINGEYLLKRIMKIYSTQASCKFILLGGYKFGTLQKIIKKDFNEFNVQTVNTGLKTNTGGRLKYLDKIILNKNFCLTYGDSLANFNLKESLKLKKNNNFIISAFNYSSQYGVLNINKKNLLSIEEKKSFLINAGFYILDKDIFNLIKHKYDSLEKKILPMVIKSKKKILVNKLKRWHPMDTTQNKRDLEKILIKNENYFNKDK